jgi:hypothetical protein
MRSNYQVMGKRKKYLFISIKRRAAEAAQKEMTLKTFTHLINFVGTLGNVIK